MYQPLKISGLTSYPDKVVTDSRRDNNEFWLNLQSQIFLNETLNITKYHTQNMKPSKNKGTFDDKGEIFHVLTVTP